MTIEQMKKNGDLYPNFDFEITTRDKNSNARTGVIKTPHGDIPTPNYIFCGTKANIKGLFPQDVNEAGADIILSNTYHIMIQPGADIIESCGGIHKFMGWNKPMLTDSGGFQIFSMRYGGIAEEIKGKKLAQKANNTLLKITEEGAYFRKYNDGKKMLVSPEISIRTQKQIGADLIVAFDELTAYHDSKAYTAKSLERTNRWEDRSLDEFKRINNHTQALYGVVQGGIYDDLRRASCEYTADRDFFGTAIGGSLGKDDIEMKKVVYGCMPHIHPDRPVHLLGIGRIKDVFEFVKAGIDTFDCVIATRIARHGTAMMKGVPGNKINLLNSRYRYDTSPLDERMQSAISKTYSKAYIHHLLKAKETLAGSIISKHNIAVITELMKEIRQAIKDGTLEYLQKDWLCE